MRKLLSGGDRRSLAGSGRVDAGLGGDPERVAGLAAALARDPDWLVRMRAIDLLEKLAHERAELVQPHKMLFIGPLADAEQWEIRLQVVRALPLLQWTARERRRVLEILLRDVDHPRRFVRAWALDSLATLARDDVSLRPVVLDHIASFERSGSKALAARARSIRARFIPAGSG